MKHNHVFPRHSQAIPPTAVRGKGCYLYDASGKAYLDGSGGAAVSCLGHGDQEIIDAVQHQASTLAFAHTGFFTSDPAEQLAAKLVDQAPGDLDRVYFVSGGSEAVEAAIKLSRQYFLEIDQPQRDRIIARRQSYHGNTIGALAAGGNEWRRQPYASLLPDVSHIGPCYAYRDQQTGETPEAYGLRVANELELEIHRIGPDRVMAFIAEPVVGATLGAVAAVPGYFQRIREICDQYGVLLILDEVMCGMGRTGSLFAYEQEFIEPDILTIAKGLGAGYQPIGAMMCTRKIYQAIADGSGFFQHGHTYIGHPVACAAGNAVVTAITQRQLLGRVQRQGLKLLTELKSLQATSAIIGDVRGRGLFAGVELVADKTTKQPFDPALAVNKKFKKIAFDHGLICYPMGGTIDGNVGDHVLLAPPFIINDNELDELISKFSDSLSDVQKAVA